MKIHYNNLVVRSAQYARRTMKISGQVARDISILQLNPLLDLHLGPINLVVFKVSSS